MRRQTHSPHTPAMTAHVAQAAEEPRGLLPGCLPGGECAGSQCLVLQARMKKDWLWTSEFAEFQARSLSSPVSG